MSEPILIDVRTVLPRDYRRAWRQALWDAHDHKCGICGGWVDIDEFQVDHILQRCLGGVDEWDNLRPAHALCNRQRARGTRDERQQATVVRYRSLYR